MENLNEIVPCVILAGGKGRRMGGKDKALIPLLDRPLLSYVLESISGHVAPIALNINTNLDKFSEFGYEIIEDPIKGHLGPLAGILASLNWARQLNQKWVMTLPCDTPFLPKNIVKEMIKLKNKELDVDLVVAQSKGYNHPVIALWKSDLNLKLEKALNEGIRKIDIFTSSLKVAYVDFDKINNDNFDPFTNLNSPLDLIKAQQILGKLPPFFGLAGWSGSGKTTLCTKLIENFTKIGITIGTLKHAHHKFELDKPGKDSFNLRKAGARPMIISSKERFAMIQENDEHDEKSLFQMIEMFSKDPIQKCDLIIVEGYKNEPIPKFEVYRPIIGKPELYKEDNNIFAIASDINIESSIPTFDLNNINSISDFIIQRYNIT
ncbi:molybdenum cofactor guanylyltransferase MobA [Alphaproteobacteria bacterium]|nr:molybdenum cofactor guanylyltransferase MobA [Alphaproteobacteria bacterium]MDB9871796.1 molybdenum cofactor guanylyltransferase MobA [Alphaproteobacteria bacterium]